MTNSNWKEDTPSFTVFEYAETLDCGFWILRAEKLREEKPNPILQSVMNGLTDREREVLKIRHGLEDEEANVRIDRRRESRKTHPFLWKIESVLGHPEIVSHIGGQATSLEEAKVFAEAALEHLEDIYNKMGEQFQT